MFLFFIIVALTAHFEDGDVDGDAWKPVLEVTDIMSDVCSMTPVALFGPR